MRTFLAIVSEVFLFLFISGQVQADVFGSGSYSFNIDFVTIGNPSNADDVGSGGGSHSSPHGGVPYHYRIAIYETPKRALYYADTLGNLQLSYGGGDWSEPTTNVSWYDAATFVNWLNTSTGNHPAYDLAYNGYWSMSLWDADEAWQLGGENLYRHKDAYYFLPSEDEWYKAAYHQNNGATDHYWDYPTGGNTQPFGVGFPGNTNFMVVTDEWWETHPRNIMDTGVPSPYGTYGQRGNVREILESAHDGVNNDPYETRTVRGGSWSYSAELLQSSSRNQMDALSGNSQTGFRVASVPEPAPSLLLMCAVVALMLARVGRRQTDPQIKNH